MPSSTSPQARASESCWQEADVAAAARPTGPGTTKILTFWLMKPDSVKAATPDGEHPSVFHKYCSSGLEVGQGERARTTLLHRSPQVIFSSILMDEKVLTEAAHLYVQMKS